MAPGPIIRFHFHFLGRGEVAIYWYGLLMFSGAAVVLFTAYSALRRNGTYASYAFPLWALATGAAVVGARVAALALGKTSDPFGLTGFVSAGGLGAGALMGYTAARFWHLPPLLLGDAFMPGVAFGEALGRVGTFLAGTGYGVPSHLPWAVIVTDPRAAARPLNVPLHPTQGYLATGLVIIGIVSWQLASRRLGRGRGVAAYFVGTGVLRLLVETVRGDRIPLGPFLTLEQAVGLACVAAGTAVWIRIRARTPSAVRSL